MYQEKLDTVVSVYINGIINIKNWSCKITVFR